jgi:hypothetical protein
MAREVIRVLKRRMGQRWLSRQACICAMGSSQGIIQVAGAELADFCILSSTYPLVISYVDYHTTMFVLPCSHMSSTVLAYYICQRENTHILFRVPQS